MFYDKYVGKCLTVTLLLFLRGTQCISLLFYEFAVVLHVECLPCELVVFFLKKLAMAVLFTFDAKIVQYLA